NTLRFLASFWLISPCIAPGNALCVATPLSVIVNPSQTPLLPRHSSPSRDLDTRTITRPLPTTNSQESRRTVSPTRIS
ncbi:hypothetical protein B0H19DRAFT_1374728, partial [Mycena capillaripes]